MTDGPKVGEVWSNPRGRCYRVIAVGSTDECTIESYPMTRFGIRSGARIELMTPENGWNRVKEAEHVDRLLQTFRPGERVRAVETIVYGTGEEVHEGATGRIQETNVRGCAPLVTVAWKGRGGPGEPPHVTSPLTVASLEPACEFCDRADTHRGGPGEIAHVFVRPGEAWPP